MAFNGSGTFLRLFDWTTDKTNLVAVTASRMDDEMDGFATGLSSCLTKDGQQPATARIPFAAGTSAFAGALSGVSYSATNDANTGIYFPNADEWGLVAGGVATITSTATVVTVPVAMTITGAGSFSSTLAATGNFAINTNKFTVTASSGDTLVAGTLTTTGATTHNAAVTVSTGGAAITGNSSITGTFGVSGNFAVNTNKFTVAASSGNTLVAGTFDVTGATVLASTLSAASVTGSMVAAQAGMETGTSTTTVVTPGRQHFHASAAKAWVKFAGADATVAASYNVTGVVRDSGGDYTITIANDFSSADYAIVATGFDASNNVLCRVTAQAAGTFSINTKTLAGTDVDATAVYVICFGDL